MHIVYIIYIIYKLYVNQAIRHKKHVCPISTWWNISILRRSFRLTDNLYLVLSLYNFTKIFLISPRVNSFHQESILFTKIFSISPRVYPFHQVRISPRFSPRWVDPKIFNLKSDWLFLCDSDLPLVIARNMTVWDKFGSYEYASNYCQSKFSKIGHKSELVIFYGHLEFKPEFRHLTFLIAHGSWGHIQCEKFLSSNWEFILDAHQTDLDRESCIQ